MRSSARQWIALLIGAALAIGLPALSIWKHQQQLSSGDALKFALRPIDPYDPFRGRYVSLAFGQLLATPADASTEFSPGHTAYLSYGKDADGFVEPQHLHDAAPRNKPFLKVTIGYPSEGETIGYRLPFDRYYLNELDAPRAEQLASEAMASQATGNSGDEGRRAFIIARVLDGEAAVEALYLDGKPIEEILRQRSVVD